MYGVKGFKIGRLKNQLSQFYNIRKKTPSERNFYIRGADPGFGVSKKIII